MTEETPKDMETTCFDGVSGLELRPKGVPQDIRHPFHRHQLASSNTSPTRAIEQGSVSQQTLYALHYTLCQCVCLRVTWPLILTLWLRVLV